MARQHRYQSDGGIKSFSTLVRATVPNADPLALLATMIELGAVRASGEAVDPADQRFRRHMLRAGRSCHCGRMCLGTYLRLARFG